MLEDLSIARLTLRLKPKVDEVRSSAGETVYAANGQTQRRQLNRMMRDAGWGYFQEYVTYKAAWAGKRVVKVNPAYTSQLCSQCGNIDKKDEDAQIYHCEVCGLLLPRCPQRRHQYPEHWARE